MVLTLIICAVTILLMVLSIFFVPSVRLGKFQMGGYCFFALLGATLLLVFGCVSGEGVLNGLFGASGVNPVKILVLFLTMTVFSVFLDELGFFRYLASVALRRAGSSQRTLFFLLYATVAVLTVFTSNDIIILTFTPFICAFARAARIDALPYLFAEFFAANTWSMTLLIGNPTNMYIASFLELDFFSYLSVMWLPTVAAGTLSLGILYALFRRRLAAPIEAPPPAAAPVAEKALLTVGVVHLALCILLLSISSYIGLEMWWISLTLAATLMLCVLVYRRRRRESPVILVRTLRRMPWELVPFMLSMFLLVIALGENGVCDVLVSLLGERMPVAVYGVSSFLSANLINNIPMSVLFATLAEGVGLQGAAYAAVIGSNLGACLTPVGALAGIMWADILRRERIPFDYRDFLRIGGIASLPTLAAALGVLALVL